ncbi:MAG: hypothetical protein JSR33_11710 [Proteobacteria bacterium]|nr:hypothetical protein [Pseudomonadota bacterium]
MGGAQTRLPAHVVNEYCRGDRPFELGPQEWESKLPRTREVPEIWVHTQSKYRKGSWYIAPSSKDKLGLDFAFCRLRWSKQSALEARCVGLQGWQVGRSSALGDLKALQSLWMTRTQQLELLVRQLNTPSLVVGSATGKVEPATFNI